MVHHSIAIVITSFLTNFVELRKAEVRRSPNAEDKQCMLVLPNQQRIFRDRVHGQHGATHLSDPPRPFANRLPRRFAAGRRMGP